MIEEEGVVVRMDGSGGEEEEERKGKTVVVGVRMDQQSRELLTWALVKVASPGDRVVALHVLPTSAAASMEVSDRDGKCSSLLSLVKEFDSVLAVYEGFCNLKQVDLKLKICTGSSLRKILVREANSFAAATLILGITKNGRTIGSSSTSVAKYCAKKLPGDCSVLAVSNGKIVFQREALPSCRDSESKDGDRELSACLASAAQKLTSMNCAELPNGSSCKSKARKDSDATVPSVHCLDAVAKDVDEKKTCLICKPQSKHQSTPSIGSKESPCDRSKEESLVAVPVQKPETPSSSGSFLARGLPEVRPGWPLLRRVTFGDNKSSALEKSKVSVVQWAMRLPSRYTASSVVHPDRKPTKSNANATSKADGDNMAKVSVGSDSSSSSVEIQEEEEDLPIELKSLAEKYSSLCRLFSYNELMQATSNFSPDKLIGKGGSSLVYKGCLTDGKALAVKSLKSSEDAIKEFVSEIEIITTLHHQNIISLFGFSFERNNLILVYDLFSRGSIEENLQGDKESRSVLGWPERYKVAVGIAEALAYLHGGKSGQPVIHRDVKSSNILIGDDFEPKLSDFGLAKWSSAAVSTITCTDVAGTFGYLAPEYFMYGKVTEKIDVYAFGVVLLELLSGKKPICSGCSKGQESLVMWAKPILQGGKVEQLVDPCLGGDYDNDQMERIVLAASLCVRRAPKSRPRMPLVVKLLRGDEEIVKWARLQVSASEELDGLDDEVASPNSDIQSYINLALLDVEDDSFSVSSVEPPVDFVTAKVSLEEYLQGRWSRSSSFD